MGRAAAEPPGRDEGGHGEEADAWAQVKDSEHKTGRTWRRLERGGESQGGGEVPGRTASCWPE